MFSPRLLPWPSVGCHNGPPTSSARHGGRWRIPPGAASTPQGFKAHLSPTEEVAPNSERRGKSLTTFNALLKALVLQAPLRHIHIRLRGLQVCASRCGGRVAGRAATVGPFAGGYPRIRLGWLTRSATYDIIQRRYDGSIMQDIQCNAALPIPHSASLRVVPQSAVCADRHLEQGWLELPGMARPAMVTNTLPVANDGG